MALGGAPKLHMATRDGRTGPAICALSCLIAAVAVHAAFFGIEANWCSDPPDRDAFVVIHRHDNYQLLRFETMGTLSANSGAVLFVHGHAGSYSQGRTFASLLNKNGDSVEFFAVDFEEELSALSASTVWKQARFVRDSIRTLGCRPMAIVGHSMGGIVAQAALLLPGWECNPVRLLLTLGTPHRSPPFLISTHLLELYDRIHQAHAKNYTGQLSVLPIVAVAGGERDGLVRADLSVPPSRVLLEGRALFVPTTRIPEWMLPVDHRCLCWCEQLLTPLCGLLKLALQNTVRAPQDLVEVARSRLLLGTAVASLVPELSPCSSELHVQKSRQHRFFQAHAEETICFKVKVHAGNTMVMSSSVPLRVLGIYHNRTKLDLSEYSETITRPQLSLLTRTPTSLLVLPQPGRFAEIHMKLSQPGWIRGCFAHREDLELQWGQWWEMGSTVVSSNATPVNFLTLPWVHPLLAISVVIQSTEHSSATLHPTLLHSPPAILETMSSSRTEFTLRQGFATDSNLFLTQLVLVSGWPQARLSVRFHWSATMARVLRCFAPVCIPVTLACCMSYICLATHPIVSNCGVSCFLLVFSLCVLGGCLSVVSPQMVVTRADSFDAITGLKLTPAVGTLKWLIGCLSMNIGLLGLRTAGLIKRWLSSLILSAFPAFRMFGWRKWQVVVLPICLMVAPISSAWIVLCVPSESKVRQQHMSTSSHAMALVHFLAILLYTVSAGATGWEEWWQTSLLVSPHVVHTMLLIEQHPHNSWTVTAVWGGAFCVICVWGSHILPTALSVCWYASILQLLFLLLEQDARG